MSNRRKILIAVGILILLVAGATSAVVVSRDDSDSAARSLNLGLNMQTYTGVYDADTQYLGKCAVVTPPKADPCDAVQGTIRYAFFGALVNADLFKKWKAGSPGDYQRLTAHMNAPACSSGTGLPQDMKTQTGAAFYAAVQAYACALGTEPIVWPAPNPPRQAGATDKTPPSAPGPITVTPETTTTG